MRKDWDTYFMDLAYMASTRATCPRRHVGAVLSRDRKTLGTGYNGSPSKVADCYDDGCDLVENYEIDIIDNVETPVKKNHCVRSIHAEQNLILFTDSQDRKGATVYVTDQPCWTCANLLANSGIIEIVYHRPYLKHYDKVKGLFEKKSIIFRQLVSYKTPDGVQQDIIDEYQQTKGSV